jgi:hypothetical protein
MPFAFNANLAAAHQDPAFWRAQRSSLAIVHYTLLKPFSKNYKKHHVYAGEQAREIVEEWWRVAAECKEEESASAAAKAAAESEPWRDKTRSY